MSSSESFSSSPSGNSADRGELASKKYQTYLPTKEDESELSLVMDLTKKECFTTTVQVRQNQCGTFRYAIHKVVDTQLEGLVGASPTSCDQIQQSSLVRQYIPKRKQQHQQIVKQGSKLFEKIQEKNTETSDEVLVTS